MRILIWFITLPLTLFILSFAVSNTETVEVFFTPFTSSVDIYLSFICLGMLILGFLCGALYVWIHDLKQRGKSWNKLRQVKKELEEEKKKEHTDTSLPIAS